MGYNAVIFDLDGTLLNSLDDLADSCNKVLEQKGFQTHPIDNYKIYVGAGMYQLVESILPKSEQEPSLIKECMRVVRMNYADNWNNKSALYAGISDLLDSLVKGGVKISILSNKPQVYTVKCVDGFLAKWNFNPVFGQRDHVLKKPSPVAAFEIADYFNLSPDNFAFVGDSSIDMETALNAGMVGIGVLWGFRNKEELSAAGAKHIVSNPLELKEILLG